MLGGWHGRYGDPSPEFGWGVDGVLLAGWDEWPKGWDFSIRRWCFLGAGSQLDGVDLMLFGGRGI